MWSRYLHISFKLKTLDVHIGVFLRQEELFALAGQLSQLDEQIPAGFAFWTSTLLPSWPLPFSIPGRFLKTVPQAENRSKAPEVRFWSVLFALARQQSLQSRKFVADVVEGHFAVTTQCPLPLFFPGKFQESVFQKIFLGVSITFFLLVNTRFLISSQFSRQSTSVVPRKFQEAGSKPKIIQILRF